MQLRDLLLLARPYRTQLALMSVAGSLVSLAIPALGARLLGGMFGKGEAPTGVIAALLVGAVVLTALVGFLTALWSGMASARILADQRQRIYRHLQSLPIGYHENHRQGDTLALMTWEVSSLGTFLTSTLTGIPARLMTAAGAVAIMFTIDPLLASIVPVAVPLFYLIIKLIGRRLRGLAIRIREAEAEVVAVAEENLEMLPAIKSFAREDIEAARYGAAVEQAMVLAQRESRIKAAIGPAIELIAASAAITAACVSARVTRATLAT